MAARPPRQDDPTDDTIEFGIAEVAGRLDDADLTYPTTAREVVHALDDPKVDVDASGNAVRLSTALDATDGDRFDSRTDLLERLHPVFETRRRSTSNELVSRLRSLLPL